MITNFISDQKRSHWGRGEIFGPNSGPLQCLSPNFWFSFLWNSQISDPENSDCIRRVSKATLTALSYQCWIRSQRTYKWPCTSHLLKWKWIICHFSRKLLLTRFESIFCSYHLSRQWHLVSIFVDNKWRLFHRFMITISCNENCRSTSSVLVRKFELSRRANWVL